MDRRSFLSVSSAAAGASLMAAPAMADAGPQVPKQPAVLGVLAKAMVTNRMPLACNGTAFAGAGFDWLLQQGAQAHAFLIGEEHGIAENPKLAAQLFTALAPHGYNHVAVEISPPMASAIDRMMHGAGDPALRQFLAAPASRVPFFGLEEEFQWLTTAGAAMRGAPFLWGLDYDVCADRYLLAQLRSRPKPAAAAAALNALTAASIASWARYAETRDPRFIFSFAGDPNLVKAVRAAWPKPAPAAALILETLEQTLAINAAWVAGAGHQSNLLRATFMRANLMRQWQRTAPHERLFMKFGASHMVRGLSMTDVFDLGSLVPELVAERGATSFHLLVLPGPGTQTANLDPTQFRYVPGARSEYGEGMDLFDQAILPGTFTLFDTRPLRALASSTNRDMPLPLWRTIHGFDAVLVMTGSTPSTNLAGQAASPGSSAAVQPATG